MNLNDLGNILKRYYSPQVHQSLQAQQVILNMHDQSDEPNINHNINLTEMMTAANLNGFGEMVSMDFSAPLRGSNCWVIKWEQGMGWAFADFWHFCDQETFLKARIMKRDVSLLIPHSADEKPRAVVAYTREGQLP